MIFSFYRKQLKFQGGGIIMKKKLLITIAALSLLGNQIVFAESSTEDTAEIRTETVEGETDPVSHIYTFTLNDNTYTLPCKVTDFTQNGWDLGSGTLDSSTYARTIGYYKGGSEYVSFEVLNDTEENGVDLADLKVVAVNVTQSFVDAEGNNFETADGIHLGMTIDEIRELYGEPFSENSSYISYHFQERYETGDGGMRGLGDVYAGEDSFYAYWKDGSDIVERIDLQYFGIAESEDAE